jgi:hypothetical protein
LRNQAFGGGLGGFAKEDGTKSEAEGKGLAQLFNQRVVAAFNAAKARVGGEARLFHLFFDYRGVGQNKT